MTSSSPRATSDQIWMSRALDLAQLGRLSTRPNPAVGCVIVKDGVLVGEGWHQQAGEAHAEVLALAMAGSQAAGATVYVTLEPCAHFGKTPPCCHKLIDAGVYRVVVAMTDPNPLVSGKGLAALEAAGILVTLGVCSERAAAMNQGFIKRMNCGLPKVTLKLATSLDAKVALANGESQWITNEQSRLQGHLLRASQCAIMTGINSVLLDDPRLTVRLGDSDLSQQAWSNRRRIEPWKIVLDSMLRLPLTAKLCAEPNHLVIYTTEQAAVAQEQKVAQLETRGVRVFTCKTDAFGRLSLAGVIADLAQSLQCNEVLVEAGGTLMGSFLAEDLVDEIHWFSAPILLGNDAQAACQLAPLSSLTQAKRFNPIASRFLDDNLYTIYQRIKD